MEATDSGVTMATADPHLVSLLMPRSFEAEQYRCLRHKVEEQGATRGLRVVAVTSAVASDGKTMTAVNLSGALAQRPGARVLLIDADLRRPAVQTRLGYANNGRSGLEAALQPAGAPWQELVRPTQIPGLSVLPSTRSSADAYELLNSPRLSALLDEARRRYDFVVVDTPPLFPVPDSRLLSKVVDGYIVVVAAHATPRKLLAEALDLLTPVSVLGLVFNRDDRPLFGYYRSRYRNYFANYVDSLSRETA